MDQSSSHEPQTAGDGAGPESTSRPDMIDASKDRQYSISGNFHESQTNPCRVDHHGGLPNNPRCDSLGDNRTMRDTDEHDRFDKKYQRLDPNHPKDYPLTHNVKKTLANITSSLAQIIFPMVVQRLRHGEDLDQIQDWEYQRDDFEGNCAPLGTTGSAPNSSTANFKTTGLDELEHGHGAGGINHRLFKTPHRKNLHRQDDGNRTLDVDIGDPGQYLPQSAALLISVLQKNSTTEIRRRNEYKDSCLTHLPSLMDEVDDHDSLERVESFLPSDMEYMDRQAEALLESIRGDDRKRTGIDRSETGITHRGITDADSMIPCDDDESISGDMARLSHSIAHLQQDLENVDLSQLRHYYGDGFDRVSTSDGGHHDDNLWWRMKLWFSRGMIMEQKLLNSYSTRGGDHSGIGFGTEAIEGRRYIDNPALIWSVSVMWAFLLLIIGHAQIAEWVEGEDPGRLAEFMEWLFG